ncbi:Imm52 family immunity protein [Pandoraea sp. NPDC087047]|uniref:Imm52 family immunity protein n=1 Tax=Pandoraea sp. NPDC087047 TaxID=3364390 RepID=UPI0037FD8B43
METYFAAAYWGHRPESVDSCAKRLSQFLVDISLISESFKEWRKQGRSRVDAKRKKTINAMDVVELISMLDSGRIRRDVSKEVIDSLGYSASLWNGAGEENVASLMIGCGMYSNVVGLSNAVVLSLPSNFDVNSGVLQKGLMSAFVNSWDPDWAVIASHSARDEVDDHVPFLDKALYLSKAYSQAESARSGGIALSNGVLYLAAI